MQLLSQSLRRPWCGSENELNVELTEELKGRTMYKYKAYVVSVYDGDTCDVEIDLGFKIIIKERLRLLGVDTPEIRTKDKAEKKRGIQVRDKLRKLIFRQTVLIATEKEGKFGRYLADMWTSTGLHINSWLLESGYANEYFGGKR